MSAGAGAWSDVHARAGNLRPVQRITLWEADCLEYRLSGGGEW
jgi:hypothetical protein